jgi:hypothetical protein
MSVESFMREYEELTEPVFVGNTPTDLRRLQAAYFRLSANEDRIGHPAVYLSMIGSIERGKGHGTGALVWLCDLADKHDVELFGEIGDDVYCFDILNPLSEVGLPFLRPEQLVAWYKRHGFSVRRTKRHARDLRRKPVQKVQPPEVRER